MKLKRILFVLFLFISIPAAAQNYSCIKWIQASNGYIPNNAVVGGQENGRDLYIARAWYNGGLHPGKIGRGFQGCNIGYGGKEVIVNNYEVMVYSNGNDDYNWDINWGDNSSDLSLKAHEIYDAFSNDTFDGIFLKDNEKTNLEYELKELQNLALKKGCYKITDMIDNLKKDLEKALPGRSDIKNKLKNLYEASKDCH